MPKYVIHAPSEDGYWNNELGWGDVASATRFSEAETRGRSLPMSSLGDARWEQVAPPVHPLTEKYGITPPNENGEYAAETYQLCGAVPDDGLTVMAGDDSIVDFSFHGGWTREQVKAHARMFAKSPKMLALLERARNELGFAYANAESDSQADAYGAVRDEITTLLSSLKVKP